jgi:transposase
MDQKTLGDWIMYYEVHRFLREGHSIASIASIILINRRTVVKYAGMTEAEYEAFLISKLKRSKVLDNYAPFVRDRLMAHPAASAAQVHDWLKEHHPDFPAVSPKTVYNFVLAVRQQYDIPLEVASREYFVVEELPYGWQAQADFGQYVLRNREEKRKRVHFFVMMLSRSRMKFVRFSAIPFTVDTAIDAHEEAFRFFEGVTKEVVYDQDRLFLVDEKLGDLLLTKGFKTYVFEQKFGVRFCRKADPESKGKVENVVKYVKNNFLYGRVYYDIETLQIQALGWLERTGNGMPHSTTRKVPSQEWKIEKKQLQPWVSVQLLSSSLSRYVRPDHTISYQGNFYSVPMGTYKKDASVALRLIDGELHIEDKQGVFLCKHAIAATKGNKVINTDHKRDKSQKLKELIAATAQLFVNPVLATHYFALLREQKGRYLRDQVLAIRDALQGRSGELIGKVLEKCVQERYLSANLFIELLVHQEQEDQTLPAPIGKVILLDPANARKADIRPDKSDLGAYEQAFNS